MDVGKGEFTVAAWIHPTQLRQGGILCLGKYSWTHGWYFDMPNNRGVLRIETVGPDNKPNGTVASRPGVIRANQWQHVAAVVRRGEQKTRLFVNGYPVATGTVGPENLDNPSVEMHVGRIQDSQLFKGQIDDVRLYRRALAASEIAALVAPGRKFAKPPPPEKPQQFAVTLGDRRFSGTLTQPAFMMLRLEEGTWPLSVEYSGQSELDRLEITRIDKDEPLAKPFLRFEQRTPYVGVHIGLRRDCGSTLSAVGEPQRVRSTKVAEYRFEGAINNFPSPDVQKDNDNYLAGVREIAVRSEYTDGRDMPRLLVKSIEFEGPLYESWPPAMHRRAPAPR